MRAAARTKEPCAEKGSISWSAAVLPPLFGRRAGSANPCTEHWRSVRRLESGSKLPRRASKRLQKLRVSRGLLRRTPTRIATRFAQVILQVANMLFLLSDLLLFLGDLGLFLVDVLAGVALIHGFLRI